MTNSSAASPAAPTIPQVLNPLIDASGIVSPPWYRFFVSLLNKTGAGVSTPSLVYLTSGNSGITAFSAGTNKSIGTIETTGTPGQPAISTDPKISPFEYTAPDSGTLVVESGQVEISRDAGTTWLIAGLSGGAIPLRVADQVRVTWFNSVPKITWLPN